MNEKLNEKPEAAIVACLEAAIVACAERAAKPNTTAIEALQYTQAAVNAANAIIGLTDLSRRNK